MTLWWGWNPASVLQGSRDWLQQTPCSSWIQEEASVEEWNGVGFIAPVESMLKGRNPSGRKKKQGNEIFFAECKATCRISVKGQTRVRAAWCVTSLRVSRRAPQRGAKLSWKSQWGVRWQHLLLLLYSPYWEKPAVSLLILRGCKKRKNTNLCYCLDVSSVLWLSKDWMSSSIR